MTYVVNSAPDVAVWDVKRPGGFRRMGKVQLGIAISLAAHAALGVYLWKTKFEPQYREYAEAVTQVELLRPVPLPPPPPPEPEPEPPKAEAPPPPAPKPRLQPRPPAAPKAAPRVAPLPVPPVIRREETPAPPVVIRPPAPPVIAAPPPPPAPAVITQPSWSRLPSARDMARFYPQRAARRGVEGSATLSCRVTASGDLRACSVIGETPADEGFGEAALKMSSRFQMRPMTRDGQAVSGGVVRIPIRFNLPD